MPRALKDVEARLERGPTTEYKEEPTITQDLEVYYRTYGENYQYEDWLSSAIANDSEYLDLPSPWALWCYPPGWSDLFEPLFARVAQQLWRVYWLSTRPQEVTTWTFVMAFLKLFWIHQRGTGKIGLHLSLSVLTISFINIVFETTLGWLLMVGFLFYKLYTFYRACNGCSIEDRELERQVHDRRRRFCLFPYEPPHVWYMMTIVTRVPRDAFFVYINELWDAGQLSRIELYGLRWRVPLQVLLLQSTWTSVAIRVYFATYFVATLTPLLLCPFVGYQCYGGGLIVFVLGTTCMILLMAKLRAIMDEERRMFIQSMQQSVPSITSVL